MLGLPPGEQAAPGPCVLPVYNVQRE